MTMARAHLIDIAVTRWYHCIARCVRGATFFCEGATDRKEWVENRLEELSQIFAITVGGFAVLDNRIHVLVRVDPDRAQGWTDEEVVRRWARVCPPRGRRREPVPVSDDWVRGLLKDRRWVATARERLQSLSWFMKCLKEPLSRLANRQEETRGFFFEGRFKTVAILDEESLLATCAYIDLTSVGAGMAARPEASKHTSLRRRIEHMGAQARRKKQKSARAARSAGSVQSPSVEESLWLCPIEDRRGQGSSREGMVAGFTLENYLLLVKYTGRLFRTGKAPTSHEVAAVLDGLGSSADAWQARLIKLSEGRLFGRNFAASRERLQEVATQLGVKKLANLAGCPTR
ncbi:MAG: transposase [Isosphaeraceae bacterium]